MTSLVENSGKKLIKKKKSRSFSAISVAAVGSASFLLSIHDLFS